LRDVLAEDEAERPVATRPHHGLHFSQASDLGCEDDVTEVQSEGEEGQISNREEIAFNLLCPHRFTSARTKAHVHLCQFLVCVSH
jgi:hypothetical protein